MAKSGAKNTLTAARKQTGDEAARVGRLEEARRSFESVCRTDPLDVEAWVKLSLIHKRMANQAAAEACGRRAVALRPKLGFSHYALGAALHAKGQLTAAIECYRTAIGLQPDFADTHYLLANALHEMGLVHDALGCYRQALSLRPSFPEALGDLGGVLVAIGELEEAEGLLRRALTLQPTNLIALTNFSHLLRLQGKVSEAIATFRHALVLAPHAIEIIAGLAGLLEKTGKIDESTTLSERGMALAPDSPSLNLVAAQLARRGKRLQEAGDRLEALIQRPLPRDIEAECRLLLGRIYDEMGNVARAYPLIVEGKQLKATMTLTSASCRHRYLDRVATISALASGQLAACRAEPATLEDSDTPAFLIGFPRSGTTLLEQVLDSHPAIQTMEERGAVAHMVNEFIRMKGPDAEGLASLTAEELRHLRASYHAEVDRNLERTSGLLLVDKLPLNTIHVPVIWRVFPKAKFILAVRHPCDVCLSCLMQDFAVNEGMASFFTLEDTARTYAAVMSAWQKYVELLPLDYHRIRYEDLIGDVEGETRRLLAFLEVPWNDVILGHTEHARKKGAINTPSYHQVTQPIYQNAKYRWHRYRDAFEPVMPILQPFIEYFGYDQQ